mmetsp:Transcript_36966/g.115788  ORF Transcript_36966/g.115788 Transcript_36966/m.115788 type:complete len:206 (+) Transcript_36966:311-928(+)
MRRLSSSHSMIRSPPGSVTVALRSAWPSSTAAACSAQAPVPQASVGPAPRSQTFILRCVGESTCTNSVLMRAGKAGCVSNCGPTAARSSASTSSTKVMQCGLPMLMHVTFQSLPPGSGATMGAATTEPSSRVGSSVVGTSGPRSSGSPMSTVTCPSFETVGMMRPASVQMVYTFSSPAVPSSSCRNLAMQRMPFPHISGSDPSEL